jgi:hypothetical protein
MSDKAVVIWQSNCELRSGTVMANCSVREKRHRIKAPAAQSILECDRKLGQAMPSYWALPALACTVPAPLRVNLTISTAKKECA